MEGEENPPREKKETSNQFSASSSFSLLCVFSGDKGKAPVGQKNNYRGRRRTMMWETVCRRLFFFFGCPSFASAEDAAAEGFFTAAETRWKFSCHVRKRRAITRTKRRETGVGFAYTQTHTHTMMGENTAAVVVALSIFLSRQNMGSLWETRKGRLIV